MRQLKITNSITLRENDCLKRYLNEIAAEQLLSATEEEQLAARIKNGDKAAMEKLIKGNLRFVVSVAKQYQNQGMLLSDLINEGNIGLIKAAQKFDATKGFKFISYAVWWIRQSIMLALIEKVRLIRVPFNQVTQYSRIKKLQTAFEQQHGREMNDKELTEATQLSEQAIKEAIRLQSTPLSFDMPVGAEDDSSMYEFIPDYSILPTDNSLERESVKYDIEQTLTVLRPREREVVKMYYGIEHESDYSVEQIADHMEISRERVRQMKDKALKKLKKATTLSVLKTHLC
ncbi:MAG: RNA polymerase sigma factor RpoD/SigA [Bacteroidetes bacterium]|jgi:RNA polymerase primary sigma factor|nr:RNA polymerase sigma factor RpoD/SigA [Bacteroidota bacterium]